MYSPLLSPFPSSWYCVAFTDELPAGAVLSRRVTGREIVLFRTASGALSALDAHCPHLGAHLGHGGKVEGECIRCPFHGFELDGDGVCVATGYGTKAPPTARTRSWPVIERGGVVLVFHGGEPSWDVPDVDTEGWTRLRRASLPLRSHVQEIAENSADLGHFTWIHGYESVRVLRPLSTEGPYLNTRYGIRRGRRAFGVRAGIEAEFDIHQHGLGYARVEVEVPALGVRTRQYVLARPLDEDEVELTLAMSVQRIEEPKRIHPLLSLLPRGWLTERIADGAFQEFLADVRQDEPIWQHKQYVARPALAQGDGPVAQYRKWARQFSADTAATAEGGG